MSAHVAIIVLAAGEGRRFGGPKALARLEAKSWLELALERVREAGHEGITVVVGAEAERVRGSIAGSGISWVENADWKAGRTGSIICGLRSLPEGTRGALLHSVDFPFVAASTFRALVRAFEDDAEAELGIWLPLDGEKTGHPVLVGRAIWGEILALGPDEPLRRIMRADAARVATVGVDDPGIHRNINSLSDLGAGVKHTGKEER